MNNNANQEDFILTIMEVSYTNELGREVSSNLEENTDLFPADWFSIKDRKKKIQILSEAIKKKCLIIDTEGYLDIIEGIRKKDSDCQR